VDRHRRPRRWTVAAAVAVAAVIVAIGVVSRDSDKSTTVQASQHGEASELLAPSAAPPTEAMTAADGDVGASTTSLAQVTTTTAKPGTAGGSGLELGEDAGLPAKIRTHDNYDPTATSPSLDHRQTSDEGGHHPQCRRRAAGRIPQGFSLWIRVAYEGEGRVALRSNRFDHRDHLGARHDQR
jgi:hypothetical protein